MLENNTENTPCRNWVIDGLADQGGRACLSAMPPIATEYIASQRTTLSAKNGQTMTGLHVNEMLLTCS